MGRERNTTGRDSLDRYSLPWEASEWYQSMYFLD